MPTQYAGNPASYPSDFSLPDDGVAPTASQVNVAIEALGDRTANLDSRLVITRLLASSLSFGAGIARGTAAGRSVFSTKDLVWWSVGSISGANDDVRYSTDFGYTWTTSTVGAAALATPLTSLDANPSDGSLVVVGSGSTSVLTYSGGLAGGWAKRTVFGSSATSPHVVYDPVHSRWIIVGYDTAQRAYTSNDGGATWTAATSVLPGTQRPIVAINKVSGRAVALNTSAGTTIKIMTSDDGGQTWTARADVTPGLSSLSSSNFPPGLAYSPDEGIWLMSVTNNGSSLSEILVSGDDGNTWTLRASLTLRGPFFGDFVASGKLWLGYAGGTNGLIYSVNSGVTWRATGWRPNSSTTSVTLASYAGAVLATTTYGGAGYSYPSAAKTDLFGTVL